MSEVAEKIRRIFKDEFWKKAGGFTVNDQIKIIEKEVLAAVESLELQIVNKEFARQEAVQDRQKVEQRLLECEKEFTRQLEHLSNKKVELRLSEIHQKMREQIIRLGMIRAGNIDQIWDAGWAYGLLHQLGKAPEFKTRKESFEWAKAKICRFQKREDSERMLLKDEQQKKD